MKKKFSKILGVGLALVLLVCLLIMSVTPVMAAAQKMDLRENPPWCNVPAEDSLVAGFVVLNNDNETDEVVVVVSLKEGAPNQTYGIFLEEYDGIVGGRDNWLSWNYIGDLTTNRNGHGNFDVRLSHDPGTYYLQIVVSYPWGSWGVQSFGTNIAPVMIE